VSFWYWVGIVAISGDFFRANVGVFMAHAGNFAVASLQLMLTRLPVVSLHFQVGSCRLIHLCWNVQRISRAGLPEKLVQESQQLQHMLKPGGCRPSGLLTTVRCDPSYTNPQQWVCGHVLWPEPQAQAKAALFAVTVQPNVAEGTRLLMCCWCRRFCGTPLPT
jgi:hypothetical protein